MNSRVTCLWVAAASFAAVAWAETDGTQFLSRIVAKLGALERVTDVPHRMDDSTSPLCVLTYNPNIHEGATDPAYCHVYVTPDARESMESGKAPYPPGAVIVKAKLENEKARDAVLYTVMRKMEAGYDPDHGDWEYAVVDGPTKRVLGRGRIDSCIDCHRHYAATDYVTRAYMKQE